MLCNNYQTSISLIGRSSLNCCLAHQPAATNSVLLQFTCTCLIGDTFGIQWNICDGAFLRKTLTSFGYFCTRAPSSIIDRILNATLSNNLTIIDDVLLIYTITKPKKTSWTNPASSLHFSKTVEVFSNFTPVT